MNNRIFIFVIVVVLVIPGCSKENTTTSPPAKVDAKTCASKWMTKNLDVDHYRNGDSIPEVRDNKKWTELTTGAWCYYDNYPGIGQTIGKLYNWYAVHDPRGLAPVGWHVASDDEWKALEMCLGMSKTEADKSGYRGTDEGGKLKETGTELWGGVNTGATNESGFSALPGGARDFETGEFFKLGMCGYWWTSTDLSDNVWLRYLLSDYAYIYRYFGDKNHGFSVRCVKDN